MTKKIYNRLERFLQLKRGIRGSRAHLIVGIDVAKGKHHAFFGTATGKTLLRRLIFDNSREGFERLLSEVRRQKEMHGLKEVVFGLEPTANYHKPLGEYLIKGGEEVVLVGTVAVKHNRRLMDGRWDKNDTKDAANVADLISQGKCLHYEHAELRLRELRNLLSLKRRLRRQEHGYRVRIRNHLVAQYFPELDTYYSESESTGLAVVRWCLSPKEIGGLRVEEFIRRVTQGRPGIRQRRRLEAIWERAKGSIGCEVGERVAFEAQVMVEGLRQIRETMKETEDRIREICKGFREYGYLLSVPGFGPDISSKVLGAIGNPFRFRVGKQVIKMAGYDLSAERSGENSDRATPVISKQGKADLRYALYQAAQIASSKNRDFRIYYAKKLKGREREKGIHTKIKVKLAAKLLVIAWTLMKKKEAFNPLYLSVA